MYVLSAVLAFTLAAQTAQWVPTPFCSKPEVDPRGYEKVLLPVVPMKPGDANSSPSWIVDFYGRNAAGHDVQVFQDYDAYFGMSDAAFWGCSIPAGRTWTDYFQSTSAGNFGAFLYVPRGEAELLDFHVRVQYPQHVPFDPLADGFGTELQVVRESDAPTGRVDLMNITTDRRLRQALHLYSFAAAPREFRLRFYETYAETPIVELTAWAVPAAEDARRAHPLAPAYARVDIGKTAIPALVPLTRIRVEVEPVVPGPFWAFASLTHNRTQFVTTVSPSR